MDIEKLNQAILKMIEDSKEGIVSAGIYGSKDDLLIVGNNTSDGVTSVVNHLFKVFFEKLQMFDFSNSLDVSVLVFEDKVFYTSKINDDFSLTTILDPKKIEIGHFKGVLLREFYKMI